MRIQRPYNLIMKFLVGILVFIMAFGIYVEIVNKNSAHMTTRQKILKAVYPVWMWFAGKRQISTSQLSGGKTNPPVSFYSLKDTAIDGTVFYFEKLKGKKVLLVNTASDCGYTAQYDDLQKLYEQYAGKLVIIGFPANDFKEQEKGTDEDIAVFCKKNFGVSFPLMKKSSVIKGSQQNEVFAWLTHSEQNGWNNDQPSWNFCKFLVDETGKLTHYFGSTVEPLGTAMKTALNQ